MKKALAILFALHLSAAAKAATVDYLIPESLPGVGDYTRIRTWLDLAANKSHTDASFYQVLRGTNVQVESAVVDNRVPLNPLHMPLEVSGHRYWVPLQFNSVDNYAKLERRTGGRAGVYFIQRGFRMNSNSDGVDRVDVAIRIADLNGNPLASLEYHEVSRPSHY